jgi:hypothetical protein
LSLLLMTAAGASGSITDSMKISLSLAEARERLGSFRS